jgi:hypothetical protein
MTTILADALTAIGVDTYSVTFDSVTQKFTIYNGAAVSAPFALGFGTPTDTGDRNPRFVLGFPAGTTTSQSFIGPGPPLAGNVLVAPYVNQMSGPNYLYVNSTIMGPATQMYLPKGAISLGGGNAGPQCAKIPVNTSPGGIVYWQDPDPQKWFSTESLHDITNMDFYLSIGNQGAQKPLQLNGSAFSLTIGILTTDDTITSVIDSGTTETTMAYANKRQRFG